jgi:hypothetical protein
MNAADIKYGQGAYNPAGTTRILWAFAEDVLSIPPLPTPATALTFDLLVEITTAIVMKSTKRMFDLYCTSEEGEIKSKSSGPKDGKGRENTFEFSYPGNDPLFLGWDAATDNNPLIMLVLEKNGKWRLLGDLLDPAYKEDSDSTSGKKVSDGRATKVTFKAVGAIPAPIYNPAGGIASLLVAAI